VPEGLGCVIVAGGRSTRLPNKCFRTLGNRSLIAHVFERVSQVAKQVVVSVRSQDQAARIHVLLPAATVVLDETQIETPLAGFLSGLRAIRTQYVFVVSCDMPFVEPNLVRFLLSRAAGMSASLPTVGGVPQPLCAVYHRLRTVRAVEVTLQGGRFSVREMLAQLEGIVHVSEKELTEVDPLLLSFHNVNTDRDLAWAEQVLRKLPS